MNMAEHMHFRFDLMYSIPEILTSHMRSIVYSEVSILVSWPMCNDDICIIWNCLPHLINLITSLLIKRPGVTIEPWSDR